MCACALAGASSAPAMTQQRDLLCLHVVLPPGSDEDAAGEAARTGRRAARGSCDGTRERVGVQALGGTRPGQEAPAARAPRRAGTRRARRPPAAPAAPRRRAWRAAVAPGERPSRRAGNATARRVASQSRATVEQRKRAAARNATRREQRDSDACAPRRSSDRAPCTVRLNCSNSETRSMKSISHVPPGLSTAELRM